MHSEEEAAGLHAARRMFDADKASAGLGIELVELAPGRAVARMRSRRPMLNGHAIGHGGYVFLLADTAFALACNSHGPVDGRGRGGRQLPGAGRRGGRADGDAPWSGWCSGGAGSMT